MALSIVLSKNRFNAMMLCIAKIALHLPFSPAAVQLRKLVAAGEIASLQRNGLFPFDMG